jgi:hypothetical protein
MISGLRVTANAPVDLVAENADDGVRLDHSSVFAAQIQLLSQRVLAGEVFLRKGLIDRKDEGSGGGIAVATMRPRTIGVRKVRA